MAKKETPTVPTVGEAEVKQNDVQQIINSLPPEVKQAVVVEDLQNVLEREAAKGLKTPDPDEVEHYDEVAPDEAQAALIARVLEGGKEFKVLHEKLTVLFDRIRPDVQELKDNVFKVRRGSAGEEVLIGDTVMDWETFCFHCFGVGTKRINQLLEIADKEHGTTVKQSPKVHLTKDDYQKAMDEKYAEGLAAAKAANEADDESVVPDLVQKLEQTLTHATTVADKSYEYFHQFKDEPETYAMELSAMLIEHGLEFTTIERITKLMLKDAKKTLCDFAVKAVAA